MYHDYRALDALRGFAALGTAFAAWSAAITPGGDLLAVRFHHFVDFFFVASGLVLAAVYRDRLRGRSELATFAALRLARLYPLHLFYLLPLIGYALFRLGEPGDMALIEGLAAELTLTQVLSWGLPQGWSAMGWYVAAEFWVAMGFALLCLTGVMNSETGRSVLLVAVVFAGIWLMGEGRRPHDPGAAALARGFVAFGLGVAAESALRVQALRDVLRRLGGGAEAAALGFAALFLWAADAAMLTAAPLVFAVVAGVVVGADGALSRGLRMAPFRLLGAYSYSIFIGHFALLIPFMALQSGLGEQAGMVNHLLGLYVLTTVSAAALAQHVAEVPARAFVHDWLARRRWARAGMAGPAPA